MKNYNCTFGRPATILLTVWQSLSFYCPLAYYLTHVTTKVFGL